MRNANGNGNGNEKRDKSVDFVFESKDYSKFKTFIFNRDLKERAITKLMDSMVILGFIKPIIVDKDMNIIDGQHRFEAAKRLGISIIYYIIDTDNKPNLIPLLNANQSPWELESYLKYFSYKGYDHYKYAADYIHRYELQQVTHFLLIVNNKSWEDSTDAFRRGQFALTDQQKQKAEEKGQQLLDIKYNSDTFLSFRSSGSFQRAIINVIKTEGYSHEQMLYKLSKYVNKIGRGSKIEDYVNCFEQVYNMYIHHTNQIDFTRKATKS